MMMLMEGKDSPISVDNGPTIIDAAGSRNAFPPALSDFNRFKINRTIFADYNPVTGWTRTPNADAPYLEEKITKHYVFDSWDQEFPHGVNKSEEYRSVAVGLWIDLDGTADLD